MIEQIINWFNGLDQNTIENIIVSLFGFVLISVMIYFGLMREGIINRKKTITQKYREGLIKK